jgi:hypothetical protein
VCLADRGGASGTAGIAPKPKEGLDKWGPVTMRDWPTNLNKFDLLWSFWLRSIFIQLPWIICFAVLAWFVVSSQGISLNECSVEHPWIRCVCFGAALAIGSHILIVADSRRVEPLRLAAGQTSRQTSRPLCSECCMGLQLLGLGHASH